MEKLAVWVTLAVLLGGAFFIVAQQVNKRKIRARAFIGKLTQEANKVSITHVCEASRVDDSAPSPDGGKKSQQVSFSVRKLHRFDGYVSKDRNTYYLLIPADVVDGINREIHGDMTKRSLQQFILNGQPKNDVVKTGFTGAPANVKYYEAEGTRYAAFIYYETEP